MLLDAGKGGFVAGKDKKFQNFLRREKPHVHKHPRRNLAEQDRRNAEAEIPVARFVVPDTHPENGSHAAAEDGEQKERLFRHAARALHLAPRLVPAVDGEGQHIDGEQINDERCRAARNEYRRQAVRSADHAERKRSAHRSSFASSTAAAAPRRALLNTS